MKEKDLDKNLEKIIIDGLIKEAEQESADFAAAVRKMSNEEFEEMVMQPAYAEYDDADDVEEAYYATVEDEIVEDAMSSPASIGSAVTVNADSSVEEDRKPERIVPLRHKAEFGFKRFRPWIVAAVSAAAVILVVLIPSINAMNAKLCESALYMSEAYITAPKGGFDVSSASIEQIRAELPSLKERYDASIIMDGKLIHCTDDFQDAGWTLAIAYLKLHKKSDAVKVLKMLASEKQSTPFGKHCAKMLDQLD